MTGYVSLNRLLRLARTLRSVNDTDAAMLGKLIETFVHDFEESAQPSTTVAVPSNGPKRFAQADSHPVLTAVTLRLRKRLGDDVCGAWIAKLMFVSETAGVVSLSAPTKFMADHIYTQYGDVLLSAWQAEQPGVVRVEVAASGGFSSSDSEQPRTCRSPGPAPQVSV